MICHHCGTAIPRAANRCPRNLAGRSLFEAVDILEEETVIDPDSWQGLVDLRLDNPGNPTFGAVWLDLGIPDRRAVRRAVAGDLRMIRQHEARRREEADAAGPEDLPVWDEGHPLEAFA